METCRQLNLAANDWIVVKVGTSTLTANGRVDQDYINELARQIAFLRDEHWIKTILVTSAAIKAGLSQLGFARVRLLCEQQAAASIGQPDLMDIYRRSFHHHNSRVGQILLTKEDCLDSKRAQNIKNTFRQLFDWTAIPIVNENDSVATEEIVFGDNDTLAAYVAIAAECKLVINLTDVDGLIGQYRVIPHISLVDDAMLKTARLLESNGTGGMVTKLEAAKLLIAQKIPMVIANGRTKNIVSRIIQGESIGTFCG